MYLLYTPLGYLSRGIYPKGSIFPVRRNEEYPGVPKNNSPGCAPGAKTTACPGGVWAVKGADPCGICGKPVFPCKDIHPGVPGFAVVG